jgi:DDE superfamily endonuclease
MECLYDTHSPLVEDLSIILPYVRALASEFTRTISVRAKNAVQSCVGFMDGTLVQIAKPRGAAQRATYSGHKRTNGLKHQAITAPNGIILNLFGP